MSRPSWALAILLFVLVGFTIFFNLWNPPNVEIPDEEQIATPFNEVDAVRRVQETFSALGKAREDLGRRAVEAERRLAAEEATEEAAKAASEKVSE